MVGALTFLSFHLSRMLIRLLVVVGAALGLSLGFLPSCAENELKSFIPLDSESRLSLVDAWGGEDGMVGVR